MKKIIYLVSFLVVSFYATAQTQVIRTTPANTVADSRLRALLNFYVPFGTNPSLNGGKDSVGGLFFKTLDSTLNVRVGNNINNSWLPLASQAYVDAKAGSASQTIVVPSVSALRVNTTFSGNVIAAQTQGYTTSGDGGKVDWYWDGTATDTDDGFSVVKPNSISGAGRWRRIFVGRLDAATLGLKTDGTDQTTLFNSLLLNNSVKEVLVNTGDISISGTLNGNGKSLVFQNGYKLKGSGTVNGGLINCDFVKQCFDTTLTVQNLENDILSIVWFGAKADYKYLVSAGTDNYPIIQKALSARRDGISDINASYRTKVYIPAQVDMSFGYFCSSSIVVNSTIEIYGDGLTQTWLEFPYKKEGFIVQRTDIAGHTHKGADFSYIHDFQIRGGGSGSPDGPYDTLTHGFDIQAAGVKLERCYALGFRGDGFLFTGAVPTSDANQCMVIGCRSLLNAGSGFKTDGSDGNAIVFINCDATVNGQWGYWESSFLGNTFIGCHAATNGWVVSYNNSAVSYLGNIYRCKRDNTGIIPGTTTNWANYWILMGAGGVTSQYHAYDSTHGYAAAGGYYFDDFNQRGSAVGCYAELDQYVGRNDGNTVIEGGFLAGYMDGSNGKIIGTANGIVSGNFISLDNADNQQAINLDGQIHALSWTDGNSNLNFSFQYYPSGPSTGMVLATENNANISYSKFLSSKAPISYIGRTGTVPYGAFSSRAFFLESEDNIQGSRLGAKSSGLKPTTIDFNDGGGDIKLNTSTNSFPLGWKATNTPSAGVVANWQSLFAETEPVVLTDGTTVAINAALGTQFKVTLAASGHTISNPTNLLVGGQMIWVWVRQDGTGGHTVTWDTKYRFPSGSAPTLSTGANATDYLHFRYNATDDKLDLVGTSIPSGATSVSSISLATPNVVFATPVNFTNSSGAWSGSLSLNSQTAKTFFAAPNGSSGTPSFRAVLPSDLGTGTPDSTKVLFGNGAWKTLSSTTAPGGNNRNVQFNNAGAFGGTDSLSWSGGILTPLGNGINMNSSSVAVPLQLNFQRSGATSAGITLNAFSNSLQVTAESDQLFYANSILDLWLGSGGQVGIATGSGPSGSYTLEVNGNVGVGTTLTTKKIIGNSTAPTVAVGPNITGTVSVTGTDLAGEVTLIITVPSGLATNDQLFTLTFNSAYAAAPYVVYSPSSATSSTTMATSYVKSVGTTNFVLGVANSGTYAATTYKWTYHVMQ